VRLEYSRSCCS